MPFHRHLIDTALLAGPVIASRTGMLIMLTVATILVGRSGGEELAFLGLGLAPQVVIQLVGIGALQGTLVLAAQARGAGQIEQCGAVLRVALRMAGVLGLLAALACLGVGDLLHAVGQQPALADGAGAVSARLAWGMPGLLLFVTCTLFLEGMGRPRAGMIVMAFANVVFAVLCFALVLGWGPFAAMGADGAAIALSVARWAMAIPMLIWLSVLPQRQAWGFGVKATAVRGMARRLLRIGFPLAIAQGVESTAFTTLVIFAGWLGATALSVYQIGNNVTAVLFMAAIGTGAATAVRVGHAVGQGDAAAMRKAGWAGPTLIALLMGGLALALLAWRAEVAAFYTADPALLAPVAGGLAVVAAVILGDGLQGVLGNALRGASDPWFPTLAQAASFWAVSVPLGYWLAFDRGLGAPGLFWGIAAGASMAALILAVRFQIVAHRPLRRL
ncbi:MATE family efflux transporter [Zavarzinia sp. CC-PAN008]|uniref:MATE family efflux transporter n=1 Tax=Zavarzinia sp. CC-PAN008 TaxID=3243332 RepID=UPI003F7478AF